MEASNPFALFTGKAEIALLKQAKRQLIVELIQHVRRNEWSQVHAAHVLGISQPRVSNLMNGHIDKFSVDSLLMFLFRLNYVPDLRVEVRAPSATGVRS